MKNAIKYELEFSLRVSPLLLYQYISTPSGLSEWFSDEVNVNGDIFTFKWEDSQEQAKLVRKKEDELVRFRWMRYSTDHDSYFEMRIVIDEITQDISLLIVDFAGSETEIKESKLIWEAQIAHLKNALGCN